MASALLRSTTIFAAAAGSSTGFGIWPVLLTPIFSSAAFFSSSVGSAGGVAAGAASGAGACSDAGGSGDYNAATAIAEVAPKRHRARETLKERASGRNGLCFLTFSKRVMVAILNPKRRRRVGGRSAFVDYALFPDRSDATVGGGTFRTTCNNFAGFPNLSVLIFRDIYKLYRTV